MSFFVSTPASSVNRNEPSSREPSSPYTLHIDSGIDATIQLDTSEIESSRIIYIVDASARGSPTAATIRFPSPSNMIHLFENALPGSVLSWTIMLQGGTKVVPVTFGILQGDSSYDTATITNTNGGQVYVQIVDPVPAGVEDVAYMVMHTVTFA